MHKELLEKLQAGHPILNYKESGNSMVPKIHSREPVDVYPVDTSKLEVGDIVIARVAGRIMCHLISAITDKRVQISNNHGHVNGWTYRNKVYGIVVSVAGREISGAREKVRETVLEA